MELPGLIATALPEELAAILRRTRGARRERGPAPAWLGTLGGRPVRIACTGAGPRRAGRVLDALLSQPAALVLGAGVAGGLSSELRRGEVLFGRSVRDEDGEAPAPDAAWGTRARSLGAQPAVFVSVPRIVTSASARARLRDGLPQDAVASVDMESAAWARVASRRGSRCLVLRAISDTASEELPGYLAACVDGEGALDRTRVVGRALLRPASVPGLLRLRRHTHQAAERLAGFLEALLGMEA